MPLERGLMESRWLWMCLVSFVLSLGMIGTSALENARIPARGAGRAGKTNGDVLEEASSVEELDLDLRLACQEPPNAWISSRSHTGHLCEAAKKRPFNAVVNSSAERPSKICHLTERQPIDAIMGWGKEDRQVEQFELSKIRDKSIQGKDNLEWVKGNQQDEVFGLAKHPHEAIQGKDNCLDSSRPSFKLPQDDWLVLSVLSQLRVSADSRPKVQERTRASDLPADQASFCYKQIDGASHSIQPQTRSTSVMGSVVNPTSSVADTFQILGENYPYSSLQPETREASLVADQTVAFSNMVGIDSDIRRPKLPITRNKATKKTPAIMEIPIISNPDGQALVNFPCSEKVSKQGSKSTKAVTTNDNQFSRKFDHQNKQQHGGSSGWQAVSTNKSKTLMSGSVNTKRRSIFNSETTKMHRNILWGHRTDQGHLSSSSGARALDIEPCGNVRNRYDGQAGELQNEKGKRVVEAPMELVEDPSLQSSPREYTLSRENGSDQSGILASIQCSNDLHSFLNLAKEYLRNVVPVSSHGFVAEEKARDVTNEYSQAQIEYPDDELKSPHARNKFVSLCIGSFYEDFFKSWEHLADYKKLIEELKAISQPKEAEVESERIKPVIDGKNFVNWVKVLTPRVLIYIRLITTLFRCDVINHDSFFNDRQATAWIFMENFWREFPLFDSEANYEKAKQNGSQSRKWELYMFLIRSLRAGTHYGPRITSVTWHFVEVWMFQESSMQILWKQIKEKNVKIRSRFKKMINDTIIFSSRSSTIGRPTNEYKIENHDGTANLIPIDKPTMNSKFLNDLLVSSSIEFNYRVKDVNKRIARLHRSHRNTVKPEPDFQSFWASAKYLKEQLSPNFMNDVSEKTAREIMNTYFKGVNRCSEEKKDLRHRTHLVYTSTALWSQRLVKSWKDFKDYKNFIYNLGKKINSHKKKVSSPNFVLSTSPKKFSRCLGTTTSRVLFLVKLIRLIFRPNEIHFESFSVTRKTKLWKSLMEFWKGFPVYDHEKTEDDVLRDFSNDPKWKIYSNLRVHLQPRKMDSPDFTSAAWHFIDVWMSQDPQEKKLWEQLFTASGRVSPDLKKMINDIMISSTITAFEITERFI